jgi:hypothetical protein
MNIATLSLKVKPSNAVDLHLEINLDNSTIFSGQIDQEITVVHNIDDSVEIDRCLTFIMSGKTSDHTVIDQNNNIVSDSMLCIEDLQFDGIDITTMFYNLATYRHNFNGNGVDTVEKFFGNMGCNGTVELKFSTPIYLWLLENM